MTRFARLTVPLVAAALAVTGCSASPPTPSVEPIPATTPAVAPSDAANRDVCVDFDARGGALYSLFVVPMMAGSGGQTSVDVDAAALTRATSSLANVGAESIADASGEIRDQGERLTASAESMGAYDNAEGTALLTSFVSLAVACQQAGHQPSWFDAAALAG